MIALGVLSPAPRFVEKRVRVELMDGDTEVRDARRDLTLVGLTSRSWGDDVGRTRPVIVMAGRATVIEPEETQTRISLPMALLRGREFVMSPEWGVSANYRRRIL